MQFSLRMLLCGTLSVCPIAACAQAAIAAPVAQYSSSFPATDQIPDAPLVRDADLIAADPQTVRGSAPSQQAAESTATDGKTQEEKAADQVKEQEKQRILGILPSFNVTYRSDAVSLTAKQKMSLAFRSQIDPYAFGVAMIVAGWGEIIDSDNGFGWGPAGFAKRAGAKYLDAFNGAMIGNGILPSVLHQDPRYFRMGHGGGMHRALYAFATSFICKHDNTGKWEPNYSNVGGNLAAGAISNLYYPSSDRTGWSTTVVNGMIVTAEGAVGAELQEFWPDISRKFFHRDPTHGLDAQAAAADEAAKKAEVDISR